MAPGACSSPSLQQQQPPPYGMVPAPKPPTPSSGKLQKAGMPEKYEKLNKSGSASPHLGAESASGCGGDLMFKSATSTGLQTTPSPQLMNYVDFEGQELTITKQVNMSYKGGPCDDLMLDQKPPQQGAQQQQQQPPPPPPLSNQNSAILNCLNSNNASNTTNTNSPVIANNQGQQQQGQGQHQQLNDDDAKIKNEFIDNFGPPTSDLSSPLGTKILELWSNKR